MLANIVKLLVPSFIYKVVPCVVVRLRLYRLRGVLYLPGRNSCPYAGFKDGIGQYDSSCCDYGAVRDNSVIHHDGAHSYENVIADYGAVDDGIMAYRDVVAYNYFRYVCGRVQYGSVLDVDSVS